MTAVVLVAVERSVATGSGPGAARLDATAYLLGAVLVLPVLLRNRYPRFELLACSALLLAYYSFDRRDISPGAPGQAARGRSARRCGRQACGAGHDAVPAPALLLRLDDLGARRQPEQRGRRG